MGEGENAIRISASNAGGTAEQINKVKYTPQRTPTVTITAPADRSRVDKAETTLKANTTNVFSDRNVVVKFNGADIKNITLDRSGLVSAPVTLREGSNTLSVTVTTPDGTDKAEVTVVYAPKIVEKPTVTFLQPGTKKTPVSKSSYQVKAKVTGVEGTANIKVFHNNTSIRRFDYNVRTQELTYTVTLKEGKNTFKVIGENTGGSTQAEADIVFKATTGAVPDVKIVSTSQPTTDPFNPNTGKSSVIAELKNVSDKNQITVTVNGTPLTTFEYTPSTGAFRCLAILKKGENTIVVKAVTPAGEDSDTAKVTF